jgi:hypothetical protein
MDVTMTGPPVTELRIHGVSGVGWADHAEAPDGAAAGPFMLYHLAFFALPPRAGQGGAGDIGNDGTVGYLRRDRGHAVAAALLRLLALACPARRLYGRPFPAYYGGPQLAELGGMLEAGIR